MRYSPDIKLSFVGGPLNGRTRRVHRAPAELAAAIALPCESGGRRRNQRRAGEMAIYQLKNDNGEWRYYHLQTTSEAELGVEETPRNEEAWSAV
jgi:hypothetical protein